LDLAMLKGGSSSPLLDVKKLMRLRRQINIVRRSGRSTLHVFAMTTRKMRSFADSLNDFVHNKHRNHQSGMTTVDRTVVAAATLMLKGGSNSPLLDVKI